MKKCPFGNGMFKELHYSDIQRTLLFFGICIWIRFLMAYIAEHYYKHPVFLWTAFTMSALVIYHLSIRYENCVWWNRSFHKNIAILIFICVAFQLFLQKYTEINTLIHPKIIALLLYIDVLYGVYSKISMMIV